MSLIWSNELDLATLPWPWDEVKLELDSIIPITFGSFNVIECGEPDGDDIVWLLVLEEDDDEDMFGWWEEGGCESGVWCEIEVGEDGIGIGIDPEEDNEEGNETIGIGFVWGVGWENKFFSERVGEREALQIMEY